MVIKMKFSFITGSSDGIEKQIGLDLLAKKYYVYFHGRHLRLNSKKENSSFISADLSSINNLDKIIHRIKQLDVLILNAGTTDRTKFGQITPEKWNEVLNVNLTNQFFLIQALRDKLNKNGSIIFISSINGIIPDTSSISYGVSKAGINILVSYLAKEFAYKKITVNAIVPGYIKTKWHKDKPIDQIQRISNKCYANRFGTKKEIANMAIALIENRFVNGQIIRVDGGWKI